MKFEKDQRFVCSGANRVHEQGRELRILAIAQKYIMCRFKGCMPFVESEKGFEKYLESIGATLIVNTKSK